MTGKLFLISKIFSAPCICFSVSSEKSLRGTNFKFNFSAKFAANVSVSKLGFRAVVTINFNISSLPKKLTELNKFIKLTEIDRIFAKEV